LIKRLETDAEDQIPTIIRKLDNWPFARGDLFYWVTVLDRFDFILQKICNEYNLKEIQTKPFSQETKSLILAIINLSRTLFENCTNRNIYNSYEVKFINISCRFYHTNIIMIAFINAFKYF
jgi:E3 ubiquitin-protein ligase HUWE1